MQVDRHSHGKLGSNRCGKSVLGSKKPFDISSSANNSRCENTEPGGPDLWAGRVDLQGPSLFEKGLVLWKIYLVSGTAWFPLCKNPNHSLEAHLFIINDPLAPK
ncbi:hypothetical protein HAX54_034020 [Datura stramonium]|uniref:Uncharacterized protein n=1 Tax=Datura stramonium TaxID=4076 RepID=A0ABS8VG36_DATST|nr:hypothetical protein [Datura stramonium]